MSTFSSISLTDVVNQILFGSSATKTTLSAPTPAANQTISIPDSGVGSSKVILQDSPSAQVVNSALNVNANLTSTTQLVCSASSNQLKLGQSILNCPNVPRTFKITDPYISTGLVTNTIVSLNNTTARPPISTFAATQWNPWEIRATSQTSTGNDDGFLRLRAGGATYTTSASWIDISGSSTVADMNKNIVLGCETEIVRVTNTGMTVASGKSLTTPSINLPSTSTTTSVVSNIGVSSTNIVYQRTGKQITLVVAGFSGVASSNGQIIINLPVDIQPNTSTFMGPFIEMYPLLNNGTQVYSSALRIIEIEDNFHQVRIRLTGGMTANTNLASGTEYVIPSFRITYML